MDKDILRRLGWDEELIEAVAAATVDVAEPGLDIADALTTIEVLDIDSSSSQIDMSDAKFTASSVVPTPGFRTPR